MLAIVVNDNACEPDKRGAVGAGLPAMFVNDNACELNKRGALESIAGKPAPTGIALSVSPGLRDSRPGRSPL
ncbi:hypothetical protein B0D71_15785 [Pseudomonas laurylsulfativorans]|uniref:Uncharacterized protein n=1 Tax=Pseudomonas laurylsulfativorans TaxID=1943631 RepID=A0A2S3VP05_9PSED|nr:hypothetical protein B0D71_15785 [Pseudomonas laurylsulfativorans]